MVLSLFPGTVRDIVLLFLLNLSVALTVTAWLGLAYGLLFRPPRWRAAVAFFVPVVGPYWGWKEGMTIRAMGLVVGAVTDVVVRWFVR